MKLYHVEMSARFQGKKVTWSAEIEAEDEEKAVEIAYESLGCTTWTPSNPLMVDAYPSGIARAIGDHDAVDRNENMTRPVG